MNMFAGGLTKEEQLYVFADGPEPAWYQFSENMDRLNREVLGRKVKEQLESEGLKVLESSREEKQKPEEKQAVPEGQEKISDQDEKNDEGARWFNLRERKQCGFYCKEDMIVWGMTAEQAEFAWSNIMKQTADEKKQKQTADKNRKNYVNQWPATEQEREKRKQGTASSSSVSGEERAEKKQKEKKQK